ncbi:hypothetical protein [Streptomyces sp. SID5473]|uniref:hypothetical protein n=1 Tax=Streptomyces sp. SID5473 TaxID=2690299 RepID=UPI00025CE511|nr:hypothetical protein [Streptomyces sp. SID5473]EIF89479.1 hypothetical protein [Streptomyces tsukubensis NRRL18488]
MTSRTGRASARRLLWTLAPVELALLAAEAAGAPMPTAVAVFARVLLIAVAVTEAVAAVRGYALARRGGEPPRAALRKVAYDRCPRVLVRVWWSTRSAHCTASGCGFGGAGTGSARATTPQGTTPRRTR